MSCRITYPEIDSSKMSFLNKPDSDTLICFTTRDLESSFRYNNLPAGFMCKTRYYCCEEAEINEVNSFYTQGRFSQAGKSRLEPQSWLERKYSIPRKNVVSLVTGGWDFNSNRQESLGRRGNNISSYYFCVTQYKMLLYSFSLNP